MDTTSSGFWTAFSALKGRKREEDNQIRLIYRLFPKEPNTFNYGKKRFFALFFAVLLFLFVIIVPNAKAAPSFWDSAPAPRFYAPRGAGEAAAPIHPPVFFAGFKDEHTGGPPPRHNPQQFR